MRASRNVAHLDAALCNLSYLWKACQGQCISLDLAAWPEVSLFVSVPPCGGFVGGWVGLTLPLRESICVCVVQWLICSSNFVYKQGIPIFVGFVHVTSTLASFAHRQSSWPSLACLSVMQIAGVEAKEARGLDLYSCCCVIGYCLAPITVFSALTLLLPRYWLCIKGCAFAYPWTLRGPTWLHGSASMSCSSMQYGRAPFLLHTFQACFSKLLVESRH